MKKLFIKLSPPRFLLLVFSILIISGTCLLKLPFATTDGISWINALFTATSASTVTGLGVVDVPTTFTLFGQLTIITLIQVGGLGIMTFAILMFIVLGKKISLQHRILLQESLNQTSIGGIIHLARVIFIFAISVEVLSALFLCISWIPKFGFLKGIYYSLFHAISAFNNAGFSLFSTNLIEYVSDPLVNIVISLLIILGGLGFTVYVDILHKRSFKKLSLHSKVTITGTLILILAGTLFIFLFEMNNNATIGSLSTFDKLMASYFQSVSLRTAGFNTIDFAFLGEATLIFMCGLMFIGAGSGSTGGGIKITSFATLLMGTINFVRGKVDVVVFSRRIDLKIIFKSLAIAMISLFVIFIAIITILISDRNIEAIKVVFEVFSAFGTVGLTAGITPDLSAIGRLVIIGMMFFGKVGPLTIFFSLTTSKQANIRYPHEDILT
ncbi:MAG: TrkH family potassium uptake protein [Bacillaceae bacterium]